MFDIGFGELLLIAVVALVVLGPERLPKAARFAGLWVRRARNQWDSVKQELERELHAEELKRNLQDMKASLRQTEAQLRDSGQQLRDEAGELRRQLEQEQASALGETGDGERATAPDADGASVDAAPKLASTEPESGSESATQTPAMHDTPPEPRP